MEENAIDLTKMAVPHVYLKSIVTDSSDNKVCTFYLRLKQPNKETFTQKEIQSLYYYLKGIMTEKIPNLVSFSPLGSLTGFSLCVLNNDKASLIKEVFYKALNEVVNFSKQPENESFNIHFVKKYAQELLGNKYN